MTALQKLWLTKIKANIRNLFKKASSAIFTILMVLLYGGIFVTLFFTDAASTITAAYMMDVHTVILITLGFVALMVFSTIFQKRKALFMQEDAFYLFSGPFSRKQVMRYLMAQTIMQSLLLGLLSLYGVFLIGSSSTGLGGVFYLIMALINASVVFFFLVLSDYLYVLSITNQKYKNVSRMIVGAFLGLVVIIFGITLLQSDFNLQNGLLNFLESPLFYIVPIFGWAKLALIGYVEAAYMLTAAGLIMIAIALYVVYYFFTSFQGEFYEKAMQDAEEFTAYYRKAKAGKDVSLENKKIKDVTMDFKEGAGAIFSKGMLQMKKVNGFFNIREIGVIIFYFIISIMINGGIGFFMYMMVFWLFSALQQSPLVEELKNYQVYLIPDDPLKKLIAIILPTLLKITITATVAMVGAGLYYQMPILEIIQYLITVYGYIAVFVSASILSIRILKSRTSAMMENMLRMLIILACSIPSIIIIAMVFINPEWFSMGLMTVVSYSSLIMNFIISIAIVFGCRKMLNGRELNSD